MDAEGSVSPALLTEPDASTLSIEDLMMQMKPCKVVLKDCMKDESDDEVSIRDQADDGYEDSSESALRPSQRPGPAAAIG